MEPDMCREGKFKVELQTGDLNTTSAILREYFWTIENYYFKN